ncbi:response regulator [Pelagicoccus sp. SDUM812002]|uniref:response regulator n=1 Tax=Pelagicoccus sp. SDUM812002 TaxID=3041266 RepID=UPI00280F8D72|nr:response regulator [Pelagicoccus sp. SDUM812002]MDQ8187619.1 response regulator [Pelagicoccus sp. SDUM812002]
MTQRKYHILLVDDEPSILVTFRIALTRSGYELTAEPISERGLELAQSESFDLIIVDYRMPGLHGVQFIEEVRESGNNTPILLMSASESPLDSVAPQYRNNLSFEAKPMRPEKLLSAVEDLLAASKT